VPLPPAEEAVSYFFFLSAQAPSISGLLLYLSFPATNALCFVAPALLDVEWYIINLGGLTGGVYENITDRCIRASISISTAFIIL
jgi:hypothetical protein